MDKVPEVSCICITHNRVDMFRRAKKCFLNQTYENKELVVLFENDPATEEHVRNSSEYSYFELHELPEAFPFIIVQFEDENGEAYNSALRQKALLRNNDGHVLTYINSKWEYMYISPLVYEFTLIPVNDYSFKLLWNELWVNINKDGSVILTAHETDALIYGSTELVDTSVRLDLKCFEPNNRSLERYGWEKKAVRPNADSNIVFYKVMAKQRMSLGMKRNLSIRAAHGEYICVWDDDDYYSENRISNQMNFLRFSEKMACSLAYEIFFDHNSGRAYYNFERSTGHENSLLFSKKDAGQYGNLNVEEDTPLLLNFYNRNQLAIMDDPELYVYNFHKRNTCTNSHFQMFIGRSTLLDNEYTLKIKELLELPV